MPELPEVEVVRAGLARTITGSRIEAVEVLDGRALKRHLPLGSSGKDIAADPGARAGDALRSGHGQTLSDAEQRARAVDIERRLVGRTLGLPVRRGKFIWVPLSAAAHHGARPEALMIHLGMSGQVWVHEPGREAAPAIRHPRIRLWLESASGSSLQMDFADQRLFGSLAIDSLSPSNDGKPGGFASAELLRGVQDPRSEAASLVPDSAAHVARDALDPALDLGAVATAMRARSAPIKALVLDQSLVSGIGNIYADEALWEARVHPARPGREVSAQATRRVLEAARAVMTRALAEGGTSFDAQYVNVNGESGYFSRSLRAYGRTGEPCLRCGRPMRRVMVSGRSTHFCSRCQRR